MKFPRMNRRAAPASNLLTINNFGGINAALSPALIENNESPDMKNLVLDERGTLQKRTGYDSIFESLGEGSINGMHIYQSSEGDIFLFAHSTKLYKLVDNTPTEIGTIADAEVSFFDFNGKCYILDGTTYWQYDGTALAEVAGYIPTVLVSATPAGDGETYEDINLISDGFKASYSGNGTDTVYTLPFTGLSATAVTATVNGVEKTEGAGITVNRTTGKVTFSSAPASGTNNVEITAYKAFNKADTIKKMTRAHIFGGAQDTRVFLFGHPDEKAFVRYSGLLDPTYWPENSFHKIGSENNPVQAMATQYSSCIILKDFAEGDTLIWSMGFEITSEGAASFPVSPLNYQVGCTAPHSVQIIDNNPVWLDRNGVYALVQSSIKDERNTKHISEAIDSLLPSSLDGAVSADFDRKYMLNIGSEVFIFDYDLGVWLYWDNIGASCFIEHDGRLYFGDSSRGLIYRFKKLTDSYPYNDNGGAIGAHWRSKHFDFGAGERLKLIDRLFFTLKPGQKSFVTVRYRTDSTDWEELDTVQLSLFNYALFDYSILTYASNTFPQSKAEKVRAKKIVYFQVEFSNANVNESLGINEISMKYQMQREVK